MFEDKSLVCTDCSNEFIFSIGEQEFFHLRGLTNEPRRCSDCRILSRLKREGRGAAASAQVCCAECGKQTRVPFQPKGYRPVYCCGCFALRKTQAAVVAVV